VKLFDSDYVSLRVTRISFSLARLRAVVRDLNPTVMFRRKIVHQMQEEKKVREPWPSN
jgi:hypothetical protein